MLAALIRKFHQANISNELYVELWGNGKPRREFLHVDDLADACVFLMQNYNSSEIINIGFGKDISIAELADLIKGTTGCRTEIIYNRDNLDGMMNKLLDSSKIRDMGWRPKIKLKDGIKNTYQWFLNSQWVK